MLIGHDAYGASGQHGLGSIPRMLALIARSAMVPELRGGSLTTQDSQSMTTPTRLLETGKLSIVIDRPVTLSVREVREVRPVAAGVSFRQCT